MARIYDAEMEVVIVDFDDIEKEENKKEIEK